MCFFPGDIQITFEALIFAKRHTNIQEIKLPPVTRLTCSGELMYSMGIIANNTVLYMLESC